MGRFFIGLRRLMIYVGIGALSHALLWSSVFDFNSAWTWAWLLAWPAVFVFFFFKAFVWIVLAILLIVGVIYIWEKVR